MATSTFISSSLVSSNVYLWDKYGSNAYLNGGIALTRKAAADANGRFCWSSGTLSRFTNTATPKLYDPIYATAAATDQTVVTSVTSVGATGIYAGGSGLLLAPTTRLGCVEMNTSGGISRNGDTLSWGPDTNLSGWLNSRYVPLSKTSTGTPTPMTYELTSTMYGNMFTPNASAVVGSVGISTGYGTLLLNSYTVVDTIRAQVPAGALTIPSEVAASVALANKQGALTILGNTLLLDSDNNLSLRIATGVATTSSAYWEYKVPTELAVRNAINVASGDCINHADDLYDTIINSHYATEVWVTENFALKGEGGGGQIEGSYGPATYNSEGMVRPVLDGGLIITNAAHADLAIASANASTFGGMRIGSNFYTTARTLNNVVYEHCLTLSSATSDVLGGITVPAGNGGLTLSSGALSLAPASTYVNYAGASAGTYGGVKVVGSVASTADSTYLNSGYVPSVQAVYAHVSDTLTAYTDTTTLEADYVKKTDFPKSGNAGIIIPGDGLTQSGYVVGVSEATNNAIGGVIVTSNTGLSIMNGRLSLNNDMYDAFYYQYTGVVNNNDSYLIRNIQVLDSTGRVLYYDRAYSDTIATNAIQTIYGTITQYGDVAASDCTSVTETKKYGWKVNGAIVYYTMTSTPSVGDPVYDVQGVADDVIKGYVNGVTGTGQTITGITASLWQYTQGTTSSAATDATFSFPIVTLRTGAYIGMVQHHRVQAGPVISGVPLQGGKPVSQGDGLIVSDMHDSYTVTLDKATTGAIGGVVIGNGIDVNAGGTISVAASASAKPVSQGTGIAVTDAGGSYTVALNKAGAASIGGVQVPNNSGLSLNTTDGTLKLSAATNTSIGGVIVPVSKGLGINNGSITIASASKYTTYNGAAEQASSGNLGGVVVMTTLAAATTEAESAASVVPTVNAVYSAISATGAKPISQGTGVTVTDNTDSTTISLNSATSSTIGGVYIPNYSGLALSNGKLTIDPNEVDTYRVRPDAIENGSRLFRTSRQLAVDSAGHILYYTPYSENYVSTTAPVKKLYATLEYKGEKTVTRYATGDSGGRYCWTSGAAQFFTTKDTPEQYEPVYSKIRDDADICGHISNIPAATGFRFKQWQGSITNTSITNTANSQCTQIAEISLNSDMSADVYQIQTGAIISGFAGVNGTKVVSAGAGITVTDKYTSYTVATKPATASTIGGIIVGTGLSVTGTGNTSLLEAPTNSTYIDASTASIGGVKVLSVIPTSDENYTTAAIVPNTEAVISYAEQKYSGDFRAFLDTYGSTPKIFVSPGEIYINGHTLSVFTTTLNYDVAADEGTTVWLNIMPSGYTYSGAWIYGTTVTSIPIAGYTGGKLTQYQHGPVVLSGEPGSVAGQGGGGGGTDYMGDFDVTSPGAGSTISVAGGAVYTDGNTTARTISTVTCTVTAGTTGKTLWLNIPKTGNATATATPSMNNTMYSVPLAYVIGSTVCQYQHGPVVIRGRWA